MTDTSNSSQSQKPWNTFFSYLPEAMGAEHGDWRSRISREKAPLLVEALDYAERTGIELCFLHISEYPDIPFGQANCVARMIAIRYREGLLFSDFLGGTAHEINHIRHADKCPAYPASSVLARDLYKLQESQSYDLAGSYHIPSVADEVLLRFISEIDSHTITGMAGRESRKIFSPQDICPSPEGQELLDALYKVISEDEELFSTCVNLTIEGFPTIFEFFNKTREIHQITPSIHIAPVSTKDIQNMTYGVWEKCGYVSPFSTEQGQHLIDDLRLKIANHPACIAATQEMQQILCEVNHTRAPALRHGGLLGRSKSGPEMTPQ